MPHDKNDKEIMAGDTVYVPCLVMTVYNDVNNCNVELETIEPMFPGTTKNSIGLNSRQVLKCSSSIVKHMIDTGYSSQAVEEAAQHGFSGMKKAEE